jgi:SAM-dependent methyltransferase
MPAPGVHGSPPRPFYSEYAWAFDLLIDRPVRRESTAIAGWLVERGVRPGSRVLDAGCGTGRYAAELARRGYVVHAVDQSPELLMVARGSADSRPNLSFAVADIRQLPADRYDAVLCRGVLNDLLEDAERDATLAGFTRVLRPDGVLVLDVREWEASAERKQREPLFRKRVATEHGLLTFDSVTDVDHATRRLVLRERHTLRAGDQEQSSEYLFVMRCWTRDELEAGLGRHGFVRLSRYGAYHSAAAAGTTDRLVVVCQRAAALPS